MISKQTIEGALKYYPGIQTNMDLKGVWYNELGSKMTISTISDGQIDGLYDTAVGSATGKYVLTGRTEIKYDGPSQSVGWVVMWEGEHGSLDSLTSWSGQLQKIDGEEVITAFWLLTIETKPGANWKSTLIGEDVFKRGKPSEESVAKAIQYKRSSHPL